MSNNETGMTVARQLTMLHRIPRSPLKVTTTELLAALKDSGYEVSKRTVERDLHSLSAQFPLALDDRSKPFGWSWTKDAKLEFMPRLTQSQSVALLLARTHLRDLLPQPLNQELAPIFNTAEESLRTSGWKDWHERTAVVPMGIRHIPAPLSPAVLAAVQSALAKRRCLEAMYRTKGTALPKKYKVHPLGLLSRGPTIYLICTLFDYQDVVQLALHRMTSAIDSDERSKQPPNFNFQTYVTTEARQYGSAGPTKLTVRFEPRAGEHLREMPISTDQKIREIPSGQMEVTATVENDELLRWWLRGFGRFAEVIKPVKLRNEMRKELEASLLVYR